MFGEVLLAAGLWASGSAVPAQEQAVPAAKPQDEIVVKGEKDKRARKVCKRATPTGSLMPKVTCRTAGEWEVARERDVAELERVKQEKRMRDQVQLERRGS